MMNIKIQIKIRFILFATITASTLFSGASWATETQEQEQEQTVFTYRAPEDDLDTRFEYDNALLKLALDKTVDEYGPYTLQPSPVMNFKRAINFVEKNTLPNFFIKQSYTDTLAESIHFVHVPVDRGIVGYRAFFISKKNKYKLEQIQTLDDLKKLTIVQGTGWTDVEILRNAGFDVVTLDNYDSIFSFVAKGRADLFPRGANELLGEYESFKNSRPLHTEDLEYDHKFMLYYPLPRFFVTSKENKKQAERVKRGLEIAWQDGSFAALWEEQYGQYVRELNIKDRTIFKIENTLIKNLDSSYEKYIFDPR